MVFRRSAGSDPLSRALAWFSIGLGAAQAQSPTLLCRTVGISPTEGSRTVMRAVGLQELLVGTGILVRPRQAGLLWARVAGDLTHLVLLGRALRSGDTGRRSLARFLPRRTPDGTDRDQVIRTIAAVAGITLLDVIAGVRQSRAQTDADALRARASLTVNRPTEDVYRRWRNLEQLPEFMAHLESVRATGDGRSHWVVRAPAGRTVEWDAEIVEDRPNEVIAWRSVDRATVPNAGRVQLAPTREGRATEMTVELEYRPPAGRLGRAVATLLGEQPQQQLRDDLRRFKQVMETGEVARSDGTPEGTRSRRLLRQRPGQPPS